MGYIAGNDSIVPALQPHESAPMSPQRTRLHGFTMIEMVAVTAIITTLIVLLLPAVQSAREMARRSSCASNLTQIGLATHAYHVSFEQFPMQLSGTDGSVKRGDDNDRRLSFLVGLLPFIDKASLWEEIGSQLPRAPDPYATMGDPYAMSAMSDGDGLSVEFAAPADGIAADGSAPGGATADGTRQPETLPAWNIGGPEPGQIGYHPWADDVAFYRCPSDPGVGSPGLGRTNYAACLGDGVMGADTGPFKEVNGRFVFDAALAAETEAAMRGVFVPRVATKLSDVTDGISHTILLAEIATDLGDRNVRTRAAAGPGITLRDAPLWCQDQKLIDLDRLEFWVPHSSKLQNTPEWGRGLRWADGMPLYTGMNTILAPNREIVLRDDRDDCWGILPPSSRHSAGVNVCFADGSVRFINETIDAGDSRTPTVYRGSVHPPGSESPFGLWGALGTRGSGELKWKPD